MHYFKWLCILELHFIHFYLLTFLYSHNSLKVADSKDFSSVLTVSLLYPNIYQIYPRPSSFHLTRVPWYRRTIDQAVKHSCQTHKTLSVRHANENVRYTSILHLAKMGLVKTSSVSIDCNQVEFWQKKSACLYCLILHAH